MTVTWGTPSSSSFPYFQFNTFWNQCLSICYHDEHCMMVFERFTEPETCFGYAFGDVQSVTKGNLSIGDKVGIKVNITDDQCAFLNISTSYKGTFNATTSYQLIDNSESLVFKYKSFPEIEYCGDVVESREQCAKDFSKCPHTMIQIPFYVNLYYPKHQHITVSWRECLVTCLNTEKCFLATMLELEGMTRCCYGIPGTVKFVEERNDAMRIRGAIKIHLDNSTCSLDSSNVLANRISKAPENTIVQLNNTGSRTNFIWTQN